MFSKIESNAIIPTIGKILKEYMCSDVCCIVLEYMDYSRNKNETKKNMNECLEIIKSLSTQKQNYENQRNIDSSNIIAFKFLCTFIKKYKYTPKFVVEKLIKIDNNKTINDICYDRQLSIDQLLKMPTKDHYIHVNNKKYQLRISLFEQISLKKIFHRIKKYWNINKYKIKSIGYLDIKFGTYLINILRVTTNDFDTFDKCINNWSYERPYYHHKQLHNHGLPYISAYKQSELHYVCIELLTYFENMELKKRIPLMGVICDKVNNKTLKINGTIYKIRDSSKVYNEFNCNSKKYRRIKGYSFASYGNRFGRCDNKEVCEDTHSPFIECCINRRWIPIYKL